MPQITTLQITRPVRGTTSVPTQLKINRVGQADSLVAEEFFLRVRVCNSGAYANSTNATIAAGTGTTVAETHTANKDLTFKAASLSAVKVTVTDATAETVTVRLGPPAFSGDLVDYSPKIDITHAA